MRLERVPVCVEPLNPFEAHRKPQCRSPELHRQEGVWKDDILHERRPEQVRAKSGMLGVLPELFGAEVDPTPSAYFA